MQGPRQRFKLMGSQIFFITSYKNNYPTEKAKNCEIGRKSMQNCNKLGRRLEEIRFKVSDLLFHCVTLSILSKIDGFQEPTSRNQWVPRNP